MPIGTPYRFSKSSSRGLRRRLSSNFSEAARASDGALILGKARAILRQGAASNRLAFPFPLHLFDRGRPHAGARSARWQLPPPFVSLQTKERSAPCFSSQSF